MAEHTRDLTPLVFDSLHERARKLGLLQHADTARTFASINPTRPRSIDRKLFAFVDERVTRFAQHLRDTNAFANAIPPPVVDGISCGIEFETNLSLNAPAPILARHVLITAPTGGTKTVYAHFLVLQARSRGMHVWIADPKLDARYLAAQDEDFLIIERDTPFNLLQPLSFVDRAAHIHLLAHCFAKTHFGGEHTMQVVEIALTKAYEQHTVPCFADVLTIVESLAPKGSRYGWVDAVRSVQHKLWRLRDRYPVAFTTRSCKFDLLFERSLYVPLLFQSTSDEFVFAALAHLLFLHHHHAGIRDLTTLVLYDEGLTGWSSKPANIDQAPVLATLQVQLREMGIGMIVTSAAISMTSALLKSNVHTRITMGAGNPLDIDELTRTFQFTPEQRDYLLTRITPGQAIVKIGTDAPRLVTFPNSTADKRVPAHAWQAALRRSDILRIAEPLQVLAAREEIDSTGQPTPSQATSSSPPSCVALVEELPHNTEVPSNTKEVLLLNTRERKILTYIARRGVLLVTELHAELHLHAMQESRTRKNLRALGFVDQHRIIVRSGRGGTAIALTATDNAYELLHMAKAHLGKGGVQHRFVLRELRDHLGATLEVHGADAVIAYNTERHTGLIKTLDPITSAALHTGDVLAIEVELTTKHVAENLARNTTHGFTATIILTLPADLEKTKRSVQQLAQTHPVLIGDALRFLDEIRRTS